ncbi:L-2-hydroxyglutarate dehydrogenase, mitochondrial-like [Oscarella lobularis]|uniref:L-2-hydroxyglutarate dehydrogenase, mitochondrial-like n=1 Tax=Oscarella lobularis TaxID=121494 RepID=UPI003313C36F
MASSFAWKRFLQSERSSKRWISAKSSRHFDLIVVGGGIVGLATARELLLRHKNHSVALLEKEKRLAAHQTGHNSGVIHSGIYYTPGSLKAKLCVEGMDLIYKYCNENDVPYKKCGKIIVAVEESELPRLDALYERALQNRVKGVCMIDGKSIKDIEPLCKGLKAIHSPETGIIDYGQLARSFGRTFEDLGGKIFTETEVVNFSQNQDSVCVHAKDGSTFSGRHVITCGGLQADQLATLSGGKRDPQIVPFRGEYLVLKPGKRHLIKGNIYPVPDPRFPFLGVHFTPRMDGNVWLGPNAVLAFAREGYKFWNIKWADLKSALLYSGFRNLAAKHLSFGMKEFFRSALLAAQIVQLQKYVPDLQIDDVTRGPAGVRAQALSPDGSLVDDFIFDSGSGELESRVLHVRNAPSPAATSSLAIAKMIAKEAEEKFEI